MKLDEAIEYFDLEAKGLMDYNDPKWLKAKQLGIEALKELQFIRSHYRHLALGLIPGETEE